EDQHGPWQAAEQRDILYERAAERPEVLWQRAARSATGGQQGYALEREQHAEGGDERWDAQEAGDGAVEDTDQQSEAVQEQDHPPGVGGVAERQQCTDKYREGDQRTLRQVESASDDNEQLPACQDYQRRRAPHEVEELGRLDEARVEDGYPHDDADEHDKH